MVVLLQAELPPKRGTLSLARSTAALYAVLRGAAAVLIVWQAAIWIFEPPRFMLPTPADVLAVFMGRYDFLLRHAGITLGEIALGLLFGTLAGAATAIGTAALPRVGQLVWPLVLVAQALPVFAIAP